MKQKQTAPGEYKDLKHSVQQGHKIWVIRISLHSSFIVLIYIKIISYEA
jgi:hypothetical protein